MYNKAWCCHFKCIICTAYNSCKFEIHNHQLCNWQRQHTILQLIQAVIWRLPRPNQLLLNVLAAVVFQHYIQRRCQEEQVVDARIRWACRNELDLTTKQRATHAVNYRLLDYITNHIVADTREHTKCTGYSSRAGFIVETSDTGKEKVDIWLTTDNIIAHETALMYTKPSFVQFN